MPGTSAGCIGWVSTRSALRRSGAACSNGTAMERARIISELARFGSIDALIAAHGSLTAEVVSSVLRYASDLVAAEEAPAFETSPLYRAYNGFMLGPFFAGS